ncbi:carboxypeptidase regulatory-like domain-containing protein [Pigmentiphaga sp. CHJ604]|uniref:carboxypeptidase regulatory-like domain-containing protein n=1 Tax=Pigmentiphaga sp. CHJ604 TaxID=3081984 RepID=UPI0030CC4DB8
MKHDATLGESPAGGRARVGKSRLPALLAALGASLVLAACGGGDGSSSSPQPTDPEPPTNPEPPVTVTGKVKGKVINGQTGEAIQNARLSNGSASATSNAQGEFELAGVAPASRTVIRVNATGYGEGLPTAAVVANQTTDIATVELQPVDVTGGGDAATAITVTAPNTPASVSLPANGLVRPDGSPATGPVSVALSAVNPALNVNAMPGQYLVATAGGGTGVMESWGAINVTLQNTAGERLNLAPGKTATIRIPVATRSASNPATIPLFYFDEATGFWKQEGSATLAGSGADQYYEGTVSHFTYWNADQLMNTVYVNGCVADDAGASSLANILVTSDGIDYSSSSSIRTDAQGKFRIAMKKGGKATLFAQQGVKLSNTVSVGPFATDTTLTECLSLTTLTDAISIKLTWGAKPADVDSHLFTPDGTEIYFSNKGSLGTDPFVNLDVDDTTGFGPEVVTIRKLMVGTYTYALYNYSGTYEPGMTGSPVRVELNNKGSLSVFGPTSGEVAGSTRWWTVFKLTVDASCRVTVNRIGAWSSTEPAPAAVTRRYCTAP